MRTLLLCFPANKAIFLEMVFMTNSFFSQFEVVFIFLTISVLQISTLDQHLHPFFDNHHINLMQNTYSTITTYSIF